MNRLQRMVFLAALLVTTLGVVPAWAQVDFSGEWAPRFWEDQPERVPGPELGNYLGIPINDAARMRGDTWDAAIQTLPEWQCRPHMADYIWRGPSNLRISKEVDPASRTITAFHAEWLRSVDRVVYLDGRPHPPEGAMHTWAGFSTAKWEGDVLTVTTTHLKEGWIRRNGITRSDRATVTEHFIKHDNRLTLVTVVSDPIYLTETHVRSRDYEFENNMTIGPYPCEPVDEIDRPAGVIPHHLPGTNPFLEEYAKAHGVPLEGARGGAETLYPEYHKKLAAERASKK